MSAKRDFFTLRDLSFFSDTYPDTGRWHTIDEARMPKLAYNMADVVGSGSPVATEVETHIDKIEGGLKINGEDHELEGLLGLRDTFTMNGAYVDLRSGREVRREVIFEGIIKEVGADAYKKPELQGFDLMLGSCTRYTVTHENQRLFHWEFDSPDSLTIGGREVMRTRARTLRLA